MPTQIKYLLSEDDIPHTWYNSAAELPNLVPAPHPETRRLGASNPLQHTMHIKICGATRPADIELLAGAGVDLVGLWHGIPDGHADLSRYELRRLVAAAHATGHLEPVLVTFLNDVDALQAAVLDSKVRWVQLHGYQTPAMVRALKTAGPAELTIIKVLHLRAGDCLERTLINSYERAGVNVFLLDAMTAGGRIGSTAQRLDSAAVTNLAEQMSRPFFLAGGLSADNRPEYDEVVRHPRFFGIDVDTHAREQRGTFDADRIAAITESWLPSQTEETAA